MIVAITPNGRRQAPLTTTYLRALKAEFTEEEQAKLTLMINVINGWNRIAVGFGGWVDPAAVKSAAKAAAA